MTIENINVTQVISPESEQKDALNTDILTASTPLEVLALEELTLVNKELIDEEAQIILSCDDVMIVEESSLTEPLIAQETVKNRKDKARNDAKLLLIKLSESYPTIFPKAGTGRPVALAIGLHKSLLPIAKEWGFDGVIVRSALSWYTKQLRYQRTVANAQFRINLDGSQAEEITDDQKVHARQKITETESWIAENKPEKARAIAERRSHARKEHSVKLENKNESNSEISTQTTESAPISDNISRKPAFKKPERSTNNYAGKRNDSSSKNRQARSSANPSSNSNSSSSHLNSRSKNNIAGDSSKSEPVVGNFEDKMQSLLTKFNKH